MLVLLNTRVIEYKHFCSSSFYSLIKPETTRIQYWAKDTVPRKTGFIVKIKKYIYIHINQHYLQVYPILSILKTKWGTVLCRKWAGNRPFCLCQSKNYYRPYAPRLALSQNGHHFVYTLYLKMCKVFRKEYLRLSPKSEKEHVSFFGLKREYPVCQ